MTMVEHSWNKKFGNKYNLLIKNSKNYLMKIDNNLLQRKNNIKLNFIKLVQKYYKNIKHYRI